MAKIQNRRDFEKWLKTQPSEITQAMATRIALRVVPFWRVTESRSTWALNLMRALFISWAARIYFAHDMRSAATAAQARSAYAAADAAASSAYAVDAAVRSTYATDAAARATYASAVFAADAAADAAAAAADAAAPYASAIWKNISFDSNIANITIVGHVRERLMERPLWCSDSPKPQSFITGWMRLSSELLSFNQDWQVWIQWYERRLKGLAGGFADLTLEQDEDFCLELALKPESFWKMGPAAVNKWLADKLEALRLPKTPDIQDASIRPDWRGIRLVQSKSIASPFDEPSAQAILAALGLDFDDFHNDLIQKANVSEAALDILARTAKQLEDAKLSRTHLFRLANRKLEIELYRPIVADEWKSENSIRYDALYLRLDEALNGFPEIKNFFNKIPKPNRDLKQAEKLAELETIVESAFQTEDAKVIIDETLIEEHEAAFEDLKEDMELRRRLGGSASRPSGSFENLAGGIVNTLSRLLEKAQISFNSEADRHANEAGPYATKLVIYIWKHLTRVTKASAPGGIALYFNLLGEGAPALAAVLSLLSYVALAVSEREKPQKSE